MNSEEKITLDPNDRITWYKCTKCGSIFYNDDIECRKCHGFLEEKETMFSELVADPEFEGSLEVQEKPEYNDDFDYELDDEYDDSDNVDELASPQSEEVANDLEKEPNEGSC